MRLRSEGKNEGEKDVFRCSGSVGPSSFEGRSVE